MVRTRIAPSPTGEDIHIGTLYTAYINWIFAKQSKGSFVVRIEDTDRTRFVEGAEKKFLETFRRFGIEADESPEKSGKYGPYRQSERLAIYKKYAQELVDKGHAYVCTCSPERLAKLREEQKEKGMMPRYDGKCREISNIKNQNFVVRLKMPESGETSFEDVARGKITFQNKLIDDQVLLKSDGYPTYHLAVVVDDYLMEISHVIRAEEWLSSTPKHILLYKAFGWRLPTFCHLPILRNPDRSKMSKRKNPVWAFWYLEQGFLTEAILNYLSLMGWSHPQEKEIFSREEFIRVFKLKDLKPAGPAFDVAKLEWMNGEYIRQMKNENLKFRIYQYYKKQYPDTIIEQTIPIVKERIKKLSDYLSLCRFFFTKPKNFEIDLSSYKKLIQKMYDMLLSLDNWKADKIGEAMLGLAQKEGMKNSQFFMVLRVAVSGKRITPPLNESMEILGKEETLKRLSIANFNS